MTENYDPIEKIRKCMVLASAPGTPDEGIAAFDMAKRIASKYGIEEPQLNKSDVIITTIVKQQQQPVSLNSILKQFGWKQEFHPANRIIFCNPKFRDHKLEFSSSLDQSWIHLICGNLRYSGKDGQDLLKHLQFIA